MGAITGGRVYITHGRVNGMSVDDWFGMFLRSAQQHARAVERNENDTRIACEDDARTAMRVLNEFSENNLFPRLGRYEVEFLGVKAKGA